jgi:beta-glucosidase
MKFNDDFVWGAATAAYQIEGAYREDGKGEDIWGAFCREPGKVFHGHTGEKACDHYHRFREDVRLMKELGVDAYRFSISWSRILPDGCGTVNPKGIAFYHALIDELLDNGIEPYVTLYHWDLPLALHRKGGWLNREIVGWFEEYATLVAKEYSAKVRHFITINEPPCICGLGYVAGEHAPGFRLGPHDALVVAHNIMLCHGAATKALRDHAKGPVEIGYAPNSTACVPVEETSENIEAARRAFFELPYPSDPGYFWSVPLYSDPVLLGDYPKEYYDRFKEYLPEIGKGDLALINQPLDFLGQNIYSGVMVDAAGKKKDTDPNCPHTDMGWDILPESLYWGPKFLYERYGKPILITENGMGNADVVSADGHVHDSQRIDFTSRYLEQYHKAFLDGVPLKGYFHWSLLDNFEWAFGYSKRFGLVYTDYRTLARIPKDSFRWYKETIAESRKA